jgi:hypothetical protein
MKFKNETIYVKAKELRHLINEAANTAFFEDALSDIMLKSSLQIPFQIGLSLNTISIESKRIHLEEAENKLIELCIAIDLINSEYFKIDSVKLDSLVSELFERIPIALNNAEEEEEKRMDEIMKEFYAKEN